MEYFTNLDEVKAYAKKCLEETDYSVLSDVDETLENKSEFLGYRQSLRTLYLNPVLNFSIVKPKAVWKTSTTAQE